MISPKPHSSADARVLGEALRASSARIVAGCRDAFAQETKARANQAILDALQKNLPLFLEELISLFPQVMAGGAEMPPMPEGGIAYRAEHRLDVVIKALGGIGEVVVLEVLRLKGAVAEAFLESACREVRRFFDFKVAVYCLQFVGAQDAELALRASQLKDANEKLSGGSEISMTAAHSRQQLLQALTHELRNSLQSVLLYATALVDGPREPGVEEIVERLAISGVHLQKLLDRTHDYAPMLAGTWQARAEAVNVGRFLKELEHRHRFLAGATRTQLICKQNDGPATIRIDPTALNHIADQLVRNAIRAAKTGQVRFGVAAEGANQVLLTVADNGHGIDPVKARQIFRVMHHVAGSNFTGLKLGLLASRYLAHLMGGEITFESEVGKGTSFVVTLPAAFVQS